MRAAACTASRARSVVSVRPAQRRSSTALRIEPSASRVSGSRATPRTYSRSVRALCSVSRPRRASRRSAAPRANSTASPRAPASSARRARARSSSSGSAPRSSSPSIASITTCGAVGASARRGGCAPPRPSFDHSTRSSTTISTATPAAIIQRRAASINPKPSVGSTQPPATPRHGDSSPGAPANPGATSPRPLNPPQPVGWASKFPSAQVLRRPGQASAGASSSSSHQIASWSASAPASWQKAKRSLASGSTCGLAESTAAASVSTASVGASWPAEHAARHSASQAALMRAPRRPSSRPGRPSPRPPCAGPRRGSCGTARSAAARGARPRTSTA